MKKVKRAKVGLTFWSGEYQYVVSKIAEGSVFFHVVGYPDATLRLSSSEFKKLMKECS